MRVSEKEWTQGDSNEAQKQRWDLWRGGEEGEEFDLPMIDYYSNSFVSYADAIGFVTEQSLIGCPLARKALSLVVEYNHQYAEYKPLVSALKEKYGEVK